VGYNPINGESYTPKENVNSNGKQPETAVKTSEAENGAAQVESTDKAQEATATKATEHDKVEKPDSGNDAQKVRNEFSRVVILNSVVVRIKVIEYNCSMMISTPFTRLKNLIMGTTLCPENSF
jgi:hypothetical protein